MAQRSDSKIGVLKELPLGQLSIGRAQVRVQPNKEVEDLAQSIKTIGLLEPIVVSVVGRDEYEILTGQRRFLAHQMLGYETIQCIVVDRDVTEDEARAISLTENIVRRDLSLKEKIDACTSLYKKYGSLKVVAEETGLSQRLVSQYVKYDQLIPELQGLVDGGKLDVKAALQAQRAAQDEEGDTDCEAALKYAQEMAMMTGTQRKQFERVIKDDPHGSVEEKIERGRKQPVLKQIVVTLLPDLHGQLQAYAKDEGMSQDEAAANLIEGGLADRGFSAEATER